jgi:hypothetical protein
MATVFAQMQGNAVRTKLFGKQGRMNRLRINFTTRLAHGGHMVDIQTQ